MKTSCVRKLLGFVLIFALIQQFSWHFAQDFDFTLSAKGEFIFIDIREISIDTGTETQQDPDISICEDKIHVIWRQNEGHKIFYRYYDGKDWDSPIVISNESISSFRYNPAMAIDGNKVHVVWQESRSGDYDIYYRCFNGSEWIPEIEISDDVSSEDQWWPKVAASNGKVHVIWTDEEDGDKDIYYRRFNGISWETEIELSADNFWESEEKPDIAAQGDKLYAVWGEYDEFAAKYIYYRHFNGVSWGPEIKLGDGSHESDPSIAVNESKIYVAFMDDDDGDWDVHMYYYNGAIWEAEKEVSSDVGGEMQRQVDIAANSTTCHIVWEDERDGTFDIFYRPFNGTDFGPIQEIDQEKGGENHHSPAVAASNQKIYVVWEDLRNGDSDIYMTFGSLFPQVAETYPEVDEKNIMPNVGIIINFTRSMNTASVENAFNLTDGATILTKSNGIFYWADNNRSCSFVLYQNLSFSTEYTVIVNATAKDTYGNTLDGNKNGLPDPFPEDNYYWNFTTISAPFLLEPGWNLISLSKNQSTTDIRKIFKSIDGKYDSIQWYNITDSADNWKLHHISKPSNMNDLHQINHTMGIWINIIGGESVEFFDYGDKFSVNQSISLYPGWNLVGFPSLSNRNRTEALNNITFGSEVNSIWTYNATTQRWEEINESSYFEVGRGYWIHSKGKKTWDVPL